MPCSSSPSCGGGRNDHGRRDWSNLQYDLLFCIAGKLTTIDYITFRAVCRSWSSAVPEIPPYGPHAPYLLLRPERNGDNGDVPAGTETDIFNFLSIPDSTLHRFRIPKLVGKNCVGSQYGWLVTIDRARGELALLNPFTGQEILLPPINSLVGPMPRIDVVYANNQIAVVKAVLSADPADRTALVVAAILFLEFEWKLIFTRVGDCKWHYFGNQDHYYNYYDVMFDPRGMRLLAMAYGDQAHLRLVEIHVGSEEITTFVLDPHSIKILGHLAAYDVDDDDDDSGGSGSGSGSGILYVSRHDSFHSRRTTHIKIYEAEMDHQERRSKMTLASLGGRALFVGAGSSVSVSAADVRRLKLKANHVYFSKNMCFLLNLLSCSVDEQDISFYIKRDERRINTIDDRRSWLQPIWVSPSLRRRPTA